MMVVADNAGLPGSGFNSSSPQHQQHQQQQIPGFAMDSPAPPGSSSSSEVSQSQEPRSNGGLGEGGDQKKKSSADSMRELEDLLKKLNPLAKEFVPPSRSDPTGLLPFKFPTNNNSSNINTNNSSNNIKANGTQPQGQIPNQGQQQNQQQQQRKQNGFNPGKKRYNNRQSKAQREECIRRTVYVSDIDQQVTEEQLAALFINCGQVIDCRVCGDPNSVLRFAFVEFTDEEGARQALSLAGTMLGYYPVRVLPSKTAIVPVNPTFLPRSEDERQMCARTIYCTNIDKKVSQADVKLFFESLCGEVSRLRLLGDYHHSTRIAFVEFALAESAMAALNCSGAILGSLPIRVSPSKTPVRPRSPRPSLR